MKKIYFVVVFTFVFCMSVFSFAEIRNISAGSQCISVGQTLTVNFQIKCNPWQKVYGDILFSENSIPEYNDLCVFGESGVLSVPVTTGHNGGLMYDNNFNTSEWRDVSYVVNVPGISNPVTHIIINVKENYMQLWDWGQAIDSTGLVSISICQTLTVQPTHTSQSTSTYTQTPVWTWTPTPSVTFTPEATFSATNILHTPTLAVTVVQTVGTPTGVNVGQKLNLQVLNAGTLECENSSLLNLKFKITNYREEPVNVDSLEIKVWVNTDSTLNLNGCWDGVINDSNNQWIGTTNGNTVSFAGFSQGDCQDVDGRRINKEIVVGLKSNSNIPGNGGYLHDVLLQVYRNNWSVPFNDNCDDYSFSQSAYYADNYRFCLYENGNLISEWVSNTQADALTGREPLCLNLFTATHTMTMLFTATPTCTITPTQTQEGPAVLQIYAKNVSGGITTTEPRIKIRIANEGLSELMLYGMDIRYWYDDDGVEGEHLASVYSVYGGNLSVEEVQAAARENFAVRNGRYVSLKIISGDAILYPNTYLEIEFGFRSKYSEVMNQNNDFSFVSGFSEYMLFDKISIFNFAQLVHGDAPDHLFDFGSGKVYEDGTLVIKAADGTTESDVRALAAANNLSLIDGFEDMTGINIYYLQINDTRTVESVVSILKNSVLVADAQPNYILHALNYIPAPYPNDPLYQNPATNYTSFVYPKTPTSLGTCTSKLKPSDFFQQWSINKIGLDDYVGGWHYLGTNDNSNVSVAVLDTGGLLSKLSHDDIGQEFFNGVQAISGYSGPLKIIQGSSVPSAVYTAVATGRIIDQVGHGLHVAGIIGATHNNNIGITGALPNSNIYHKKVFPPIIEPHSCKSAGSTVNYLLTNGEIGKNPFWGDTNSILVAQAIMLAVNNSIDVINMSLGTDPRGIPQDFVLQNAINYARTFGRNGKGTVIVAAAGNSARPVIRDYGPPKNGMFPAGCDNVIAVAASDENDKLAFFSNYGQEIDVAAPGTNIWSTVLDKTYIPKYGYDTCAQGTDQDNVFLYKFRCHDYESFSGTSMAAPLVAGVAALILSKAPHLTSDEVEQIIKDSAYRAPDPANNGEPENYPTPGIPSVDNPYFGAGRLDVRNIATVMQTYMNTPIVTYTPQFTATPTMPNPTSTPSFTPVGCIKLDTSFNINDGDTLDTDGAGVQIYRTLIQGLVNFGNSVLLDKNGGTYDIYVAGASMEVSSAIKHFDMAVWKHNISGYLDNTFSGNGVLSVDNPLFVDPTPTATITETVTIEVFANDYAEDIVMDKTGNVYVVGYGYSGPQRKNDLLVTKFNKNGVIDSGFGTSGVYIFDNNGDDVGKAVVTGDNDELFITGSLFTGGSNLDDMAVWKIDSTQNVSHIKFPSQGSALGEDILLEGNNLWVVGEIYNGANKDLAIWKYDTSLNIDTGLDGSLSYCQGCVSAGGPGFVTYDSGGDDYAKAVILVDGKLIITGSSFNPANGTMDMTIWEYNIAANAFKEPVKHNNAAGGNGLDSGNSLVYNAATGKVFVAGLSIKNQYVGNFMSHFYSMIVWKYNLQNSAIEKVFAFGRSGEDFMASDIALVSDSFNSELVVAGQRIKDEKGYMTLWRILDDCEPPPTPTPIFSNTPVPTIDIAWSQNGYDSQNSKKSKYVGVSQEINSNIYNIEGNAISVIADNQSNIYVRTSSKIYKINNGTTVELADACCGNIGLGKDNHLYIINSIGNELASLKIIDKETGDILSNGQNGYYGQNLIIDNSSNIYVSHGSFGGGVFKYVDNSSTCDLQWSFHTRCPYGCAPFSIVVDIDGSAYVTQPFCEEIVGGGCANNNGVMLDKIDDSGTVIGHYEIGSAISDEYLYPQYIGRGSLIVDELSSKLYVLVFHAALDRYEYLVFDKNSISSVLDVVPVQFSGNGLPVGALSYRNSGFVFVGGAGLDTIYEYKLSDGSVNQIASTIGGEKVTTELITDREGKIYFGSENNIYVVQNTGSIPEPVINWAYVGNKKLIVINSNSDVCFSNNDEVICVGSGVAIPTPTVGGGLLASGLKSANRKLHEPLSNTTTYVYPNPVLEYTTIRFSINKIKKIKIQIFSIEGTRVWDMEVAENKLNLGINKIKWDTKDSFGNKLPVGIYLLKINDGYNVITSKIAIIR